MAWLRAAPPCQGLRGAEGTRGIPSSSAAGWALDGQQGTRLHAQPADSTVPTATNSTWLGPRPPATTPHYCSHDLMMEQLPLINVYVQRIYTSACRQLMRDISMHKSRANTVINFVADSFLII